MQPERMEELARRLETLAGPGAAADPELVGAVAAALVAEAGPGLLTDTDACLALVRRRLPGWTVMLRGEAARGDGGWSCALRETGVRDDDELFGTGRGPAPAPAILGALLRTLARRPIPA